YENGDIKSNRPRGVTPQDNLSPFWRPIELGGVGKRTFDLYRDPQAETLPDDSPNPLWAYEPVLINGMAGGTVDRIVPAAGGVAWERGGVQAFGAMTPTVEIITGASGPDGAGPFPRNTGFQIVAGVQTWSG